MMPVRPALLHPRPSARRLLACGLLLACTAAGASEDSLGVLFYSPAERLAVVRSRSDTGAGDASAGNDAAATLKLNGVVQRERNKGTAWINQRPWPEGKPIGARPAPEIAASGVTLDGQRLRIGESLDPVTGQRSDFIAPGAVSVRRSP